MKAKTFAIMGLLITAYMLLLASSATAVAVTNNSTPEILIDFRNNVDVVTITSAKISGPAPATAETDILAQIKKLSRNYFSFTPATALSDGVYTLKIKAKDDIENEMKAYANWQFRVDTAMGSISIRPVNGATVTSQKFNVYVVFIEIPKSFSVKYSDGTILNRDVTGNFTKKTDLKYIGNFSSKSDKTITIDVESVDDAGNIATAKSAFQVNLNAPDISLVKPLSGVVTRLPVNFQILTNELSVCRYSTYGGISYNDMNNFEMSSPIDGYALRHNVTIRSGISLGVSKKYYVQCKDKIGALSAVKEFLLVWDNSNPKILKAFAEPRIVYKPDLNTTIIVQTDDSTVCKYSTTSEDYASMAPFPIQHWNTTHHLHIHAPSAQKADYTYNIKCMNVVNLVSAASKVVFTINLDLPVTFTWDTPEYVNDTQFSVIVTTNREATCFAWKSGETENTDYPMSNSKKIAHSATFDENEGTYKYYVKCIVTDTNTAKKNGEVTVDTTAPSKPVVTHVTGTTDITKVWRTDELTAKWKSVDNESGIMKYAYRILKGSIALTNWSYTDDEQETVEDLKLSNTTTYKFEVYAINRAGTWSSKTTSNGVRVDTTLKPHHCQNGIKDSNESAIDCGQDCTKCAIGKTCFVNSDCVSQFCVNSICTQSTCTDNKKGPTESDVDCGGPCPGCAKDKGCLKDEDCESGLQCSNSNKCQIYLQELCNNAKLDPLYESDIDCGKGCTPIRKCADTKACAQDSDCTSGDCNENTLKCVGRTGNDIDGDGKSDSTDNCPSNENTDQKDLDKDGKGDVCDTDMDGDGILNTDEITYGLNQMDASDAKLDKDGDGLSNLDEITKTHSNPVLADTDGDLINDGKDNCPIIPNPKQKDKDHDGVGDECDTDVSAGGGFSFTWILILLIIIVIIVICLFLFYPQIFKKKKVQQKPFTPVQQQKPQGPMFSYQPVRQMVPPRVIERAPIIKPRTKDDESIKAMKARIMKEFELPSGKADEKPKKEEIKYEEPWLPTGEKAAEELLKTEKDEKPVSKDIVQKEIKVKVQKEKPVLKSNIQKAVVKKPALKPVAKDTQKDELSYMPLSSLLKPEDVIAETGRKTDSAVQKLKETIKETRGSTIKKTETKAAKVQVKSFSKAKPVISVPSGVKTTKTQTSVKKVSPTVTEATVKIQFEHPKTKVTKTEVKTTEKKTKR